MARDLPTRNLLLGRLARADLALLQPHLQAVDLPLRKHLEVRSRRIDHAYFLEGGFASVVAEGTSNGSIEVGLIGFEGVTAIAVLLGADRAAHATFMQAAGYGRCIPVPALRDAMDQSATLRRTLLRYAHSFFIQTSYTALTNGRSKVDERLARWLLMAQDRLQDDELPLTHEFLAIMLGVRRPGVTIALRNLGSQGLIQAKRGVIRIVDRAGLEKASNGAYGSAEAEFARLFGTKG